MNESFAYIAGSTVTLRVNVFADGTDDVVAASSVTLSALINGTHDLTPDDGAFTEVSTGIYTYACDTTNFDVGTWTWQVSIITDAGTSIAESTFAVKAGIAVSS